MHSRSISSREEYGSSRGVGKLPVVTDRGTPDSSCQVTYRVATERTNPGEVREPVRGNYGSARDLQGERGGAGRGGDRQVAAHALGQLAGDGEAQPRALFVVGGVEGLED